ncbi:hypothetical protein [Geomicrobium sediminis]|uniref:Phage-related minor tail protein n=1 Tax=Geomicrobium sediminis TaxID=1347788 RepID=A0ABS2P738_9BACL|nr:hypothetical protein [Geomicrobium sediminis]MBM7631097.1 phage-related minor tail protein [Geomicrobium sediminis]
MSSYEFGAKFTIKDEYSQPLKDANEQLKGTEDAAKKGGKGVDGIKKKMQGGIKTAAKWGAGIAAAGTAVVVGGVAMANQFSKTANKIDQASIKAGLHTDTLQEMQYALGQTGMGTRDVERTFERLTQRMGRAASGNEKYGKALENVGVNLADVKDGTVTTEEAFVQAIDTLHGMENAMERSDAAGDLFGTTLGRKLLPAIEEGGDALEALREEAHLFGAVIDEDAIEAGKLWGQSMDQVKTILSGVGTTLATTALPYLQRFLDYGIEHIPKIQEFMSNAMERVGSVFSWIGETGVSIFHSIRDAIQDNMPSFDLIKDQAQTFGEMLVNAWEGAQPYIEWFIDEGIPKGVEVLSDIVDSAMDLYHTIVDNWGMIEPFVIGIVTAFTAWRAITAAHAAVTGTMTAAQWALNAAMTANPIGIVVAAIGILIGIGILLWQNWDTIREKAGELWDRIRETWDNIRNRTSEIWNNVKDAISDAMVSALASVTSFFQPLLDFISNVRSAWDRLTSAFSNFSMPDIGLPKWMGGDGLLSFDVGTNAVPHDMIAQIHKGEMIVPAKQSAELRKQGVTIDNITDMSRVVRGKKEQSEPTSQVKSVQAPNKTGSGNSFNFYINGLSVDEVLNELVPKLKLALANM